MDEIMQEMEIAYNEQDWKKVIEFSSKTQFLFKLLSELKA